jgi:DNA-binding MarR family transcriptional regulator
MHTKQLHKPDTTQELLEGAPLEDYLPYQLFRIVNRLTLNLKNDLRPTRMTLARWRALAVLNASNGRSIGELALCMVIEQPALSRIISQMERDGLVSRKVANNDHRVVRVYLTAEGRRIFKKIRPFELSHFAQLIDGLKDNELRQLEKLLHKLGNNIDRIGSGTA